MAQWYTYYLLFRLKVSETKARENSISVLGSGTTDTCEKRCSKLCNEANSPKSTASSRMFFVTQISLVGEKFAESNNFSLCWGNILLLSTYFVPISLPLLGSEYIFSSINILVSAVGLINAESVKYKELSLILSG
jgi:hypothetical protein